MYNSGDVNNPSNIIKVYDAKGVYLGRDTLPSLTVSNGLSYQTITTPTNYAALDKNGRVDGKDFSYFARNWGRTGIVKGSNPNNLNDYADIAPETYDGSGVLTSYGDGTVDYQDLGAFCEEWLWDANDPNTW